MAGLVDRIQVRGQFAHTSEATDRNETGCPSNLSPHFIHVCVSWGGVEMHVQCIVAESHGMSSHLGHGTYNNVHQHAP